jgi:hypothetical protein
MLLYNTLPCKENSIQVSHGKKKKENKIKEEETSIKGEIGSKAKFMERNYKKGGDVLLSQ